jgi:hypothetical protein
MRDFAPTHRWPVEAYEPLLAGSGAEKMRSSAVAPLVAIAHGYRTVTKPTMREVAQEFSLGQLNSKHGRQLADNVGLYDAMIMPWYSPDVVNQAHRRRSAGTADPASWRPSHTSLQIRPHELSGRRNADGDRLKYDIFAGQRSTIGIHPATPNSWVGPEARVVFMTEGAIKADAALTALLLATGVSTDELAITDTDDMATALIRLHDLMERIPAADRVLITAIVGVGNWHQNPDWNSLPVRRNEFWMAFDGDVATNPNVWTQAKGMWEFVTRRGATPKLLNLDLAVDDTEAGTSFSKIGVDDYLAEFGSWASLIGRLRPELPPAPVRKAEYAVGEWRVNDEDKCCEELVETPNEFGGSTTSWVRRAGFAARIVATETARFVTESEMRTGQLADAVDAGEHNAVEVLFTWVKTSPSDPGTAVVRGPGTLMADPPDQWHRRGGRVPPALANHPDWPPRSPEWAKGVKRHRPAEITIRSVWNQMGWVPGQEGGMVFIAGNSVVDADGFSTAALPGVNEHVVAGANKFGLNPPDDDNEAAQAVKNVLAAYHGHSPWTDRRVAAVVLATALRPCVPLTPRTSIFFTGPRRKGKSWTAEAIMAFWQAYAASFRDLPGSASDTKYSTENVVARVPIWVADDLAPDADKRRSDSQQSKIGEIIRAIHNGSGQRRMNSDGSTREVLEPRAMFLVTAENTLAVSSVMDRLVHISTGDKFLSTTASTGAVEAMSRHTVTQSVVTTTCIQTVALAANELGWERARSSWSNQLDSSTDSARHHMAVGLSVERSGDASRHARIAADLALGLHLLIMTCERLGLDTEAELVDNMIDDLYSLISDCFSAQRFTTPGASLVQALRSLLAGGQAHLTAPGLGGPPLRGDDAQFGQDAPWINQRLGWPMPANAEDSPRPLGNPIGFVIADRNGILHVLFEPKVAFTAAQRYYQDMLPHGTRSEATWGSVWAEGLASSVWSRKKGGSGLTNLVRARNVVGVPVPLSVLLGLGEEDTEDGEAVEDEAS